MSIGEEVLSLSDGIRAVRVFDENGRLLEMKVRKDTKLFVPDEVVKQLYGLWFTFMSGVAENLEKFYGRLERMALNFDKVDLIIVKEGSRVCIVSSDKNVLTTELAQKIERSIRSSTRAATSSQ